MFKMTKLLSLFVLTGNFLINSAVLAQSNIQAENWCSEVERYLTDNNNNKISCTQVDKRCVKMNNYWCQKHGSAPWRGTVKPDGNDGSRDEDGHAVFQSVEWSARAIAIDLRSKYRRKLVSAAQIGAEYSPWCDTLGSRAVVKGSGRTCKDGRASPPPDFSGHYCEKPSKKNVSKADCIVGCNCPPSIAETLVRGLSIDINSDLKLFDPSGKPLPNLAVVIKNLALQEQGIFVKQEVIEKGISLLTQ